MYIKFPSARCSESRTGAHHYVRLIGRIWICKFCWQPLWQPDTLPLALELTSKSKVKGRDTVYSEMLNARPKDLEKIQVLSMLPDIRRNHKFDKLYSQVATVLDDYPELRVLVLTLL